MVFKMAWRNIWRNKMRSIIIMLSITIGLFAGIAVMALYKGMLESRVRNVIDAEVGHLQLHDSNFKKDYDPHFILPEGNEIINKLSSIPGIKSIAPRTVTMGMLSTTTGSAGVQINGIIPGKEYEISQLRKKIIEGKVFNPSKKNEVMIGKKLSDRMKLKPGSKLVLTFTDTSGTIVSGAFKITAIYRSDNAPLDERNVYINIEELNNLLGIDNAFHEMVVLLDKDERLNEMQSKLQKTFPGLQVESWKDISPETELLVNTTNKYSYIIMIIIMFALAFGIINTMLMAILERTKEIGMMMALGTTRIKVFSLILLETIFLTLAGTPLGILLGWFSTQYYSKHGLDLSGMGKEMMSSFGFGTIIYPGFPSEKLGGILLIVISTAIISCLLPALKALKLEPVEALRR